MQSTTPFTILDLNSGASSVIPLPASNHYIRKLLDQLIAGDGGRIPGLPTWSVLIKQTDHCATIDIGYGSMLLVTTSVLLWSKEHSDATWTKTCEIYGTYECRVGSDFPFDLPDKPDFSPWLATYTHAEIEMAICPLELVWIESFIVILATEIIARNMA